MCVAVNFSAAENLKHSDPSCKYECVKHVSTSTQMPLHNPTIHLHILCISSSELMVIMKIPLRTHNDRYITMKALNQEKLHTIF